MLLGEKKCVVAEPAVEESEGDMQVRGPQY